MSKHVGVLESREELVGKNNNRPYVSIKVDGKKFNLFGNLVDAGRGLKIGERVEVEWEQGKSGYPDVKNVSVQTGAATSTPTGNDAPAPRYGGKSDGDRVSIVYQVATKAAIELVSKALGGDFVWLEENHERVLHLTAKMAQSIFTDIWSSSKAIIDEIGRE